MPNFETKSGSFILNAVLNHPAPQANDTALVHGASFEVQFVPKRTGKFAILQLIRALVSVGAYEKNKTGSGWAVDKQPADGRGASNQSYALVYGITGDNIRANPHSWFGGGPSQAARTQDTPQELVPLSSEKVGTSTKFAHYAVDVDQNTVMDEGMIWSYDTSGNPADPRPEKTVLSQNKNHIEAILKFLSNVNGKDVKATFKII
jgi:hypothetical protein